MDEELVLDGNAAAGALREVFALELTAARAKCGVCGRVEPIGAERLYAHAPGLVVRCVHCDNVLIVLVEAEGRFWLSAQGVRCLELRADV